MIVFVILGYDPYESAEICGVFDSLLKAKKYVEDARKGDYGYVWDDYEIKEFEVQ